MTDNDLGNSLRSRAGVWKGLGDRLTVSALQVNATSDQEAVIAVEAESADGGVHLNLDRAQRGVGGDNSWGRAPLRDYVIEADPQSYQFWLRALRAGDDPAEIARQVLP
jgi:hypothetical protein